MRGVDGLKTGFTNASGFNLAVSAVRDNRRLIAVVLGGPTAAARNKVAEGLLLTGFDVLNRRARGEQITVAQNFFEPPQLAEATQPSMQQGDTEARPEDRLASSPPPSRASKIQIVEPKARVEAERQGPRTPPAAGPSRSAPSRAAPTPASSSPSSRRSSASTVDDARGVAEKDGGKYRARFSGMSETGRQGRLHAR